MEAIFTFCMIFPVWGILTWLVWFEVRSLWDWGFCLGSVFWSLCLVPGWAMLTYDFGQMLVWSWKDR